MESYQITGWCRHFMEEQVKPGDICIDATAGNGNDTLTLCRLAGEKGKVYAFDIQKAALEKTGRRLEAEGLRAELILDGHEHMEKYVKEKGEVSCIVFNFGYLPGGSHSLATRADTSIRAVEAGLSLLKKGGLMSLCIYSGGDSGFEEKEALLAWLKHLDGRRYLVIKSEYYNRPNHPPVPVLVIRV
ncbi:MAG TPA: methyltransferase domain-containing protein [Candidatus Bariatricus faecipullorum]|nr:methyltransferase domain-containing protein [Candidatus Bariatricus faecipullorum]